MCQTDIKWSVIQYFKAFLFTKEVSLFLNIVRSRLEQTFKPIILESYPEGHTANLDLIPSFCFP